MSATVVVAHFNNVMRLKGALRPATHLLAKRRVGLFIVLENSTVIREILLASITLLTLVIRSAFMLVLFQTTRTFKLDKTSRAAI